MQSALSVQNIIFVTECFGWFIDNFAVLAHLYAPNMLIKRLLT